MLIHFDNHEQNIIWLWSVVVADYPPAISPAFVNNLTQRRRHILHLKEPVILAADKLIPEFLGVDGLNIVTVDTLVRNISNGLSSTYRTSTGFAKAVEDAAVLMLTSGSTGHAKAFV